jgi:hypothetical protein
MVPSLSPSAPSLPSSVAPRYAMKDIVIVIKIVTLSRNKMHRKHVVEYFLLASGVEFDCVFLQVSSKIGVIESLLSKCDKLVIGGGMVFTFLKVSLSCQMTVCVGHQCTRVTVCHTLTSFAEFFL